MTSDPDLAAIRARVDAATPGPWLAHENPCDGIMGHIILSAENVIIGNYSWEHGGVLTAEDAAFIAHARDDVPALLAEVERLRAELAAARVETGISHNALIATRKMANDANAALRGKLLVALGREDDGCTPLAEYVETLAEELDQTRAARDDALTILAEMRPEP